MPNLIYLLTPFHTGTHFVRMLLESNRKINYGISESRRVPISLNSAATVSGNGLGAGKAANERLLSEYMVDYYAKAIKQDILMQAVECSNKLVPEDLVHRRLTNQAKLAGHRQAEFWDDFGLALGVKDEIEYELLYGHATTRYRGFDANAAKFPVIVTVRHPILSIISSLRRKNDALALYDYLYAVEFTFHIKNAIFICTDLWQGQPNKFLNVFKLLGLGVDPVTEKYLALSPVVNQTIAREGVHPKHNYCIEKADADLCDELVVAKTAFLDDRTIKPILRPWWNAIHNRGLWKYYEALGY